MSDGRRHSRALTLKTGKIRLMDRSDDIDCAILNISHGGACILVPAAAELPQAFRLTVDFGGGSHVCEVRWRSGSRLGVEFNEIAE